MNILLILEVLAYIANVFVWFDAEYLRLAKNGEEWGRGGAFVPVFVQPKAKVQNKTHGKACYSDLRL